MYGCGDGYEGQANVAYTFGATAAPWNRTCPRWYATRPHIAAILEDVADYRRGTLGPVDQLPAPLLEYLRIANRELEDWERENLRQMSNG